MRMLKDVSGVVKSVIGMDRKVGLNPENSMACAENYIEAHAYSNNHMDALKQDRR